MTDPLAVQGELPGLVGQQAPLSGGRGWERASQRGWDCFIAGPSATLTQDIRLLFITEGLGVEKHFKEFSALHAAQSGRAAGAWEQQHEPHTDQQEALPRSWPRSKLPSTGATGDSGPGN